MDDEAEFELICGDHCEAMASGPRDRAWKEILHYAAQYAQDGPLTVYEVTRRPVELTPECPAVAGAASPPERLFRPQWTVSQLASALELEPPEMPVYLEHDDGDKPAGRIGSYRGYYEQLAISSADSPLTAKALAKWLREVIGETVNGYKGGEYRIYETTPVWAANYGQCGSMIVGMDLRNDRITLMTEPDEI